MRKIKKEVPLKLVIGDKNLSSWSLRPWLVLCASRLDFQEVLIPLDRPESKAAIAKHSPSGKVPALLHGDLVVWDSLSICEYIAELANEQLKLWPIDPKERALARSYVAEMHSGFPNLRAQLSMDTKLRMSVNHLTDGTIAELKRVFELWKSALMHFNGKFLFGDHFGIVDAFYAPVVLRIISYGVELEDPTIEKYIENVVGFAPMKKWLKDAKAEVPFKQVFSKIRTLKLSL